MYTPTLALLCVWIHTVHAWSLFPNTTTPPTQQSKNTPLLYSIDTTSTLTEGPLTLQILTNITEPPTLHITAFAKEATYNTQTNEVETQKEVILGRFPLEIQQKRLVSKQQQPEKAKEYNAQHMYWIVAHVPQNLEEYTWLTYARNFRIELYNEYLVSNLVLSAGPNLILPGKEHQMPGAFPTPSDTNIRSITHYIEAPVSKLEDERVQSCRGPKDFDFKAVSVFSIDQLTESAKRAGFEYLKQKAISRVQTHVEEQLFSSLPAGISRELRGLRNEVTGSPNQFLFAYKTIEEMAKTYAGDSLKNVADELLSAGKDIIALCSGEQCEFAALPQESTTIPTEAAEPAGSAETTASMTSNPQVQTRFQGSSSARDSLVLREDMNAPLPLLKNNESSPRKPYQAYVEDEDSSCSEEDAEIAAEHPVTVPQNQNFVPPGNSAGSASTNALVLASLFLWLCM